MPGIASGVASVRVSRMLSHDPDRPFNPGEKVLHTGMYRIVHLPGHCPAEAVFMREDEEFPPCGGCKNTMYELVMPADIVKVSSARQFFADLQLAFHQHFGRGMTHEENWFFELAERAVTAAEHDRKDRELESCSSKK